MSDAFFSAQPSLDEMGDRIKGFPTWIEVELDTIGFNLEQVRERCGVEIIPCVKGDAYGHGLVPVVAYFMEQDIERVLVAKLWEARQIREAGLQCGVINMDPLFSEEQYKQVVSEDITQTVYRSEVAELLSLAALELEKNVKIFVKVDTGLNRVGVRHEEALELVEYITSLPGLELAGLFSTFTENREKDRHQLEYMEKLVQELEGRGIEIPVSSMASGNAVFHFPGSYLEAVRPGLMLYGIYPDPEDRDAGIELRQALALKARLEHVKYVEGGEAVTYSARFVASNRMKIGTVHAGYSDGVPRGLTRKGLVRFNGETRRILGTVSVNHCVIDLDGLEAAPGDVVEIVSRDGENTLEAVSRLAGIMTYSFCIALNPLTPRVYTRDGIPVALSELKLAS